MASAEDIAAGIRTQIESGILAPGDQVPTVSELVQQHQVAKQTASNALNILQREGLIDITGGRGGTIVRARPAARMVRSRGMERDNLGYFSGLEVQNWRLVPGSQTQVGEEPTPADVALLLGIEPGTAAVVRKRLNGDPEPGREKYRQLTDSWLHPDAVAAVPSIAGDSGLGGIYDRLEEWAGGPIEWREQVRATIASPAEAGALLLPPGVALLQLFRISTVHVDGRNLVVEVNDIRMNGDLFAAEYPMERRGDAVWPVRPASEDFYRGGGNVGGAAAG